MKEGLGGAYAFWAVGCTIDSTSQYVGAFLNERKRLLTKDNSAALVGTMHGAYMGSYLLGPYQYAVHRISFEPPPGTYALHKV